MARLHAVAVVLGVLRVAAGYAPGGMIPNTYPDDWPFLRHCVEPNAPGGLSNLECDTDASRGAAFGKASRIAIVGGGPGGLSMAKLLHDRGFLNVTVLEKAGRLGGKAKTVIIDGSPVDVGAKYACA